MDERIWFYSNLIIFFFLLFYLNILAVAPTLNLGTGELTDEAQRIVTLQREADQVNFEMFF